MCRRDAARTVVLASANLAERELLLERRAIVDLRQSTLRQVHDHHESTLRQYALGQRAIELGWPSARVEVIDDDYWMRLRLYGGRLNKARRGELHISPCRRRFRSLVFVAEQHTYS